jgi:ribonucleoside-diphosphate reductase beta chain
MSLFDQRTAFKPFEYDVTQFKKAINNSFWLVDEWNFTGDVQDFKTGMSPAERNAIKNALLAISQVEVSVKKFWARLGDHIPKPEIEQVGVTFGESEVRHADAYSHLLDVLDLNADFAEVLKVPAIRNRVDYLNRLIDLSSGTEGDFPTLLAIFTLLVENTSLFSQFAVVKSFNRHRAILKDIDNVVQATQQEEQVHASFGAYLLRIMSEEMPEMFDRSFYGHLTTAMTHAYKVECDIIDWIFEAGDLPFISRESLKEFVKARINAGMRMIGTGEVFEVDQKLLAPLQWFDDELDGEVTTDFFHKRPVTYSTGSQSYQPEDLFDVK